VTADNRRRYRRIEAQVYWRPAGVDFLERRRQPVDMSLGGVRIFSDQPMQIGDLLKMEFFTLGARPVTFTAEVVWIEPMEANASARFDVGLRFRHLDPDALGMLVSVLGPLESAPPDDAGRERDKASEK
jgi:hypothetical protein